MEHSAVRRFHWIALPALLAALLAGCEDNQIQPPPPDPSRVIWTRLTDRASVSNPLYPDWRDSTIAFQYERKIDTILIGEHIGHIDEDGSNRTLYSELGSTLDFFPRWVNDTILVYASNKANGYTSNNFDIWYRNLRSGRTRLLALTPERESGPVPRPGRPALAYTEGADPFRGRLVLMPDTATVPPERIYLTPDTLKAGEPDWDPGGDRICFTAEQPDGARHVWVMTLSGNTVVSMRPVTSGGVVDLNPRFSPDGTRIVFRSRRATQWGVWWVSPDSAGGPALVALDDPNEVVATPAWSPDGQRLVVASTGRGGLALWILSNLPF